MVAASRKPSCTCTQCHHHHAIGSKHFFMICISSLMAAHYTWHKRILLLLPSHLLRMTTPEENVPFVNALEVLDLCVRGCLTIFANRFSTHPCCNNKWLLHEMLANTWQMKQNSKGWERLSFVTDWYEMPRAQWLQSSVGRTWLVSCVIQSTLQEQTGRLTCRPLGIIPLFLYLVKNVTWLLQRNLLE